MRFVLLVLMTVAGLAAQAIDLSSLDKLAKRAKEVNTISLDGANLKTASRFLAGDDPDEQAAKAVVDGLTGVWVRNLVFRGKEEYSAKDLAAVRDQLRSGGWSRIVESKSDEDKENTEIYLRSANQKTGGLAIISEEPKELTVVVISGSIDLERLGKLSGNLGIPDIELKHKKKPGEE